MSNEFGDFEEIKIENKQNSQEQDQNIPTRVRMPRPPELLGIVSQRLGGNRMEIKTTDGKIRNCRVPGRFKRKFWLRPGDFVLITPWPDDDHKGDIVFQYQKNIVYQLKKKGMTKNLDNKF